MASNRIIDLEADEKIAGAAFDMPKEGRSVGDLVALGKAGAAPDRIVTAQPVAVYRDDEQILARLRKLAAIAGENWLYRYPVKDHGKAKTIEGPSIKCANTVARLYGNCEVDTRVFDNGDSWIIYARFIDWETGFAYTRPFEQMKGQQTIKTDDKGRQRQNAFQIGVSKSIRNVITNALEQFTTFAYEEASRNIVETVGKKLEYYKQRTVAALKELGVDIKRVELAVGRPLNQWLAPNVAGIISEIQAIQDGMATVDETWPPEAPARPSRGDFREPGEKEKPAEPEKRAEPKQPERPKEPEPEPALELEIIDLDGAPHTFDSAAKAAAFAAEALEAARKMGAATVRGFVETNQGLLQQLIETGHDKEANEIAAAWQEATAPKGKKGQADLLGG